MLLIPKDDSQQPFVYRRIGIAEGEWACTQDDRAEAEKFVLSRLQGFDTILRLIWDYLLRKQLMQHYNDGVITAIWSKGLRHAYNAYWAGQALGYRNDGSDPRRQLAAHRDEYLIYVRIWLCYWNMWLRYKRSWQRIFLQSPRNSLHFIIRFNASCILRDLWRLICYSMLPSWQVLCVLNSMSATVRWAECLSIVQFSEDAPEAPVHGYTF
jgi:hypothetical protein